jgi:hypothetical protein
VQAKLPASYAELSPVPELAGLELASASAYAPGGRDGGRAIVLGQANANDSTLLPSTFRGAVGLDTGEALERTPVALGPDELQAYRYENLRPDGADRQVTVYASPNSEGVATVVCLAPPADAAAFKAECEGVANTLQVASGDPLPVGPDQGYADLLGTTFGTLDKQVAAGRRALTRDGAQFRRQASAARDIQRAHAAAARRLRRASIRPADRAITRELAGRLAAVSAAWKRAASEAADKDKAGFARSEAGIERAQERLAIAIAGLERAGYTLSG